MEERLYRLEVLDAPCIFCGYNGQNYWQSHSHASYCPWYKIGGGAERKNALLRMHPIFQELSKGMMGEEDKQPFAEKILKFCYGQGTKWGNTGTIDDAGWRRIEERCLEIVSEIAQAQRIRDQAEKEQFGLEVAESERALCQAEFSEQVGEIFEEIEADNPWLWKKYNAYWKRLKSKYIKGGK